MSASAFFIASRLQEELRRLLRDAMELTAGAGLEPVEPKLDVLELPERLLILVEVPGVARDGIEVEVQEQDLRIRVDKAARRPTADEAHYHCVECSRGRFERRLRLPPGFDPDGLQAHLEAGVLRIEVPRTSRGPSAPRTVEITIREENRSRERTQ
ncbi:MAG: Hsp20/alpha crystallin family protein [Thermoanaerobaculia bacterium]